MQTLDSIERQHGIAWRFETPRYTFAYWAESEDIDPADCFQFDDDIEAVRSGALDWFCAFVGVFDNTTGELIGNDSLGACAYESAREFCELHRWQYSRRQKRYIKDPKSRAWKACEARRPRRPDGSRMDGHYFPDMVRTAIGIAREREIRRQFVADDQ